MNASNERNASEPPPVAQGSHPFCTFDVAY